MAIAIGRLARALIGKRGMTTRIDGCRQGSRQGHPLTDAYGTPQVFADSNYGVFFGYGYAVASDRLFQMEMLKRTAQGRVAEVLGAEFLDWISSCARNTTIPRWRIR